MNRNNIRHTLRLMLICISLFTISSCSKDSKKEAKDTVETRMVGEAEVNPEVEQLEQTPDEAFMATLQDVEDETIVLQSHETGEVLELTYRNIRTNISVMMYRCVKLLVNIAP